MGVSSSMGFSISAIYAKAVTRAVGAIVLFLALPFALLYGGFYLWKNHRSEVEDLFHFKAFSLFALVSLVAMAGALYYLRRKRIQWYAAIEFSVGVFAAWLAVASYQTRVTIQRIEDASPQAIVSVQGLADPERLLKAVAAVYLMIRALDNGLKKPDKTVKEETTELIDERIGMQLSRHRLSEALREGDMEKAQLVYREKHKDILDIWTILHESLTAFVKHRGLAVKDVGRWCNELEFELGEGDPALVMKNMLAEAEPAKV